MWSQSPCLGAAGAGCWGLEHGVAGRFGEAELVEVVDGVPLPDDVPLIVHLHQRRPPAAGGETFFLAGVLVGEDRGPGGGVAVFRAGDIVKGLAVALIIVVLARHVPGLHSLVLAEFLLVEQPLDIAVPAAGHQIQLVLIAGGGERRPRLAMTRPPGSILAGKPSRPCHT